MRRYPEEAGLIYDWSAGRTVVPYREWRQVKELEHSFRYAVHSASLEIAGSVDDLKSVGVQVLGATERGFTILSEELGEVSKEARATREEIHGLRQDVRDGTRELADTIRGGFAQTLKRLDALVNLQSNPAHTFAYEKFEQAKDQVRRGLLPEALRSIEQAIDGRGSALGIETDWQFHSLRGAILVGDTIVPDSSEVIDVAAAEAAFLLANRYARADHPKQAAIELRNAGRAAFLQSKLDVAEQRLRQAYSVVPNDASTCYHLARILYIRNSFRDGSQFLFDALCIAPYLILQAASQPEFTDGEGSAHRIATEKRVLSYFREALAAEIAGVRSDYNVIAASTFAGMTMGEFMSHYLSRENQWISSWESEKGIVGIIGTARALRSVRVDRAAFRLEAVAETRRELATHFHNEESAFRSLAYQIRDGLSKESRRRGASFDPEAWLIVGGLIGAVLGFAGEGFFGIISGGFGGAVLGFIAMIIYAFVSDADFKRTKEEREREAAEYEARAAQARASLAMVSGYDPLL